MNITICYVTARKHPRIEWFYDSLRRQGDANVLVIDFYGRYGPKPKPTPWQGEHRITSCDYFAAANARNTALCLAPDGWIAFVDDLSVLMPGWLAAVKAAVGGQYIVCGAYRKVRKLVVQDGVVVSFADEPLGHDSRSGPRVPCPPSWLFGCSVVAPIEALLSINGWPEAADGMGYEDCITGTVLANRGWQFCYEPAMLTLESEEDHHAGQAMKRVDKGQSPRDKSHALLNMYRAATEFPNYFPEGGIRALRERVQRGEPFPTGVEPKHDWFDGQPLSEM